MLKTAWVIALATCLPAQSIIPAKAGLVSHAGEAYIDDRLIEASPRQPPAVDENSVLRTGQGRAEVLLGPCAAMWLDEQSSFRMVSTALSDIRLELLTGSVIVAAGAMVKGARLTLLLNTAAASIDRKVACRFDAETPQATPHVKVLAGRTTVHWANRSIRLSAGRWLELDAAAHAQKFGLRNPGPLEEWSKGRAALLGKLASQAPVNNGAQAQPSARASDRASNTRRTGGKGITAIPRIPDSSAGCPVAPW